MESFDVLYHQSILRQWRDLISVDRNYIAPSGIQEMIETQFNLGQRVRDLMS